jgi:HEAT repeat protein
VIGLVLVSFCCSLRAEDLANGEEANPELVEMVVGFLSDADQEIRALAYDQIRTAAPGEAATKRFAEELPQLSTPAQIGLLRALADRGDRVAKPAVTTALTSSTDESLRAAAAHALGKLGDGSDIPALISLLAVDTDSTRKAARQGLVEIRGSDVLPAIVDNMADVDLPTRVALIEILTARRALTAIPALLSLAVGKEANVRAAAMASLGKLAGPEHVGGMTQGVLTAVKGAERNAAEKNLMFVCNRIPEKDKRAEPLRGAMQSLDRSQQIVMLSTLGRIGGKSALLEVDQAIDSPQAEQHAAGIQAISNWPDASVAKRLIDLARSDTHDDHKKRARLALIRIAPLPDGRTDVEKLALLKTAFTLADNDAERNYALARAAAIRIIETLDFVLQYVDLESYSQQACQTVVELAHHRKLRDENKPKFHAALDAVLSVAKDPVVIERANRYKQGQTWSRPK